MQSHAISREKSKGKGVSSEGGGGVQAGQGGEGRGCSTAVPGSRGERERLGKDLFWPWHWLTLAQSSPTQPLKSLSQTLFLQFGKSMEHREEVGLLP